VGNTAHLLQSADAGATTVARATDTGTGARTVTITVNDGTTVLENARVRVTQGAESYAASTNASGVVTFYLDAGTYYVWSQKSGWTFTNPDTEVVS